MPKLLGSDAIKEIRAFGYQGCIVSVTGNVLPEDRKKILDSGANEVLAKPLEVKELRSIITGAKSQRARCSVAK